MKTRFLEKHGCQAMWIDIIHLNHIARKQLSSYPLKKIAIEKHKIFLLQKIDYKGFEGDIREWIKCAFYLGVVFSKATEDHLSFFLGVDTK